MEMNNITIGIAENNASVPPLIFQPGDPNNKEQVIRANNLNTSLNNALCPPGLEYLTQIDQLFIKQKVELMEGFETSNKYQILNSMGQPVYFAKEECDFLSRNVLGSMRPFEMAIYNNSGYEVIHLRRFTRCCAGHEIQIEAPPGFIVGHVKQQKRTCCCSRPLFDICDATGTPQMQLEGTSALCIGEFMLLNLGNPPMEIGRISLHWPGLATAMFTDADNFGISFPIDLDVRIKACLIGATILIDFMYFEDNDRR